MNASANFSGNEHVRPQHQVHRREAVRSFNLDRLQTPIGTALLVTDADGILRALDWED